MVVKGRSYTSFLEIGVYEWNTIKYVKVPRRIGVDPHPQRSAPEGIDAYVMTSDTYFESTHNLVDLVFIDGWHGYDQAYRDVKNAVNVLNDGGLILLHDCNPRTEGMQIVPKQQVEWTGDVWKAIVRLRLESDELDVFTIDLDTGIGVVRRERSTDPIKFRDKRWDDFTWQDLSQNRGDLLGLKSLQQGLGKILNNV